MERADGGGMQG
uniref:Uncharacterized protein n=1 Tax=Arundo donax TaxID=35708 RepID=A0A0A9A7K1_ARUDO